MKSPDKTTWTIQSSGSLRLYAIWILSETNLSPDISDHDLGLTGFRNTFQNCCSSLSSDKKSGGGVFIAGFRWKWIHLALAWFRQTKSLPKGFYSEYFLLKRWLPWGFTCLWIFLYLKSQPTQYNFTIFVLQKVYRVLNMLRVICSTVMWIIYSVSYVILLDLLISMLLLLWFNLNVLCILHAIQSLNTRVWGKKLNPDLIAGSLLM